LSIITLLKRLVDLGSNRVERHLLVGEETRYMESIVIREVHLLPDVHDLVLHDVFSLDEVPLTLHLKDSCKEVRSLLLRKIVHFYMVHLVR
jgi:hypothetical protein